MSRKVEKLTESMKTIIEFEIEHPRYNIKQLAEEFNIPYPTFWTWLNSDCYKEYKSSRLKDIWKDSIKIAQDTMIDLALNGDREAAKYILSCNGYDSPKQIEVSTNVIRVTLENNDD